MRFSDLDFPQEVFRSFQDLLRHVSLVEDQCRTGQYALQSDKNSALNTVRLELEELVRLFVKRVTVTFPVAQKDADRVVEFIAIAFLDEKFIQLDWEMSNEWSENPLETVISGTRNAGTEIFDRIDALSPERVADRIYAVLYFLILSLGFAGRYDAQTDSVILQQYQKSLTAILEKSFDLSDIAGQAGHQDFSVSGITASRSYLPTARSYNVTALGLIAAVVICVQIYWFYRTYELAPVAQSIIELGY
jgi:type IV/VI secretion system ImpK/VasF family protein